MKALHVLHIENEGSAVSTVCSRFPPLILPRVGTGCIEEREKKKGKRKVRRDVIKCPVWDSSLTLKCYVIKRSLLWWRLICLKRHFLQQSTKYPGWGVWWPADVSSWVPPWVCTGTHWTWHGLEQGLSLDRSKSEKTFHADSGAVGGYMELWFSVNLHGLLCPKTCFYYFVFRRSSWWDPSV